MNKIFNKKGFTLVELLAVIVILAVLGLIAVPTIISTINSSKESLYVEQVDRILEAADSWAASNDYYLPDATDGSTPIKLKIDKLKKDGNLKNESIKNPINGSEEMDDDIAIYFDFAYNQYTAVYCESNAEYGKLYYETNYDAVKTICSNAK